MINYDKYKFQATCEGVGGFSNCGFLYHQCKCQPGVKRKWNLSITENIFISSVLPP